MSGKSDPDRDAILALLLAAYLLTQADISAMVASIAAGYLVSMQAAYREAASTVGSADGQDWTPSQEDEQAAQDWAQSQAQGIANTYKADLTAAILVFLDAWQHEKGDLSGAMAAAPGIIGQWSDKRAQWKSQQVSSDACGSGGEAGTSAFLVDLEGGLFIDTETGEVVNIGNYGIAVLPDEARCFECLDWAGGVYDVQDDVPDFPIHSWCGHERVLVMV